MKKVKVIEHGYFFRNGYLKTKCNCGCVYLTPKKKVKICSWVPPIGERSWDIWDISDYFSTICPECEKYNRQNIQELRKEMEGKHER